MGDSEPKQFRVGDRVLNRNSPEWGPGEILALPGGDKIRVHFAYAGERTLKNAPLELLTGEAAQHPLLENRKKGEPRKGARRTTIPAAISRFLSIFPAGFSDPKYLEEERSYKVVARDLMAATLGESDFSALLGARDFEDVKTRALRVVRKTNLIFTNEQMDLNDGLKTPDASQPFAISLYDLLYGTGKEEQRFAQWTRVLFDLEAPKWTTATFFQALAQPQQYLFFKPTFTQALADACSFELNYKPELNWLTYQSVQRFAQVLRAEIASLEPRDMIDVQSFIWAIVPGKHD